MAQSEVYNQVSGGFGALAASFVTQSLEVLIPWIIAMAAVVLADLISGTMKCLKLGIKIRISKFIRDSTAKFLTYFSAVVASCMIQVASNNDNIAYYTIIFFMGVELISIAGNILKMKGYNLDFNKVVSLIISKRFDVMTDDLEGCITKDKTNED